MRNKSKQLYATLLSIPSAKVTSNSFPPAPLNYRDFELNLLISPESRAEPWTPSAPIKGDENFALFALAQIASIAGVWSGSPLSVTALLQRQGFNFSQGNVVMLRAMATLVAAQGVASRMITEALEIVANPDIDPYKTSSQNDIERPESIAELNDELIRGQIELRVAEIIAQTDSAFVYDGPKKPTESDYTRLPKEAWVFFWKFTRDVVVAMPHYARDWVINKYGEVTNALLKNVREPVPEKYLGLDKELRERLAKILEFQADRDSQDALAISATAFQQMPQVWEKLRSLAFGALDGSDASDPTRKPLVFPSVDYVAADPANRFPIDSSIKNLLDLDLDELGVDDVAGVRDLVSKLINESNANLDLMRKRLAAFENGTILLEDPNAPEPDQSLVEDSEVGVSDEIGGETEVQSRVQPARPQKSPRFRKPAETGLNLPSFVNDTPPVSADQSTPPIEVSELEPAFESPAQDERSSLSEDDPETDSVPQMDSTPEEEQPEGAAQEIAQALDDTPAEPVPGSPLQGLLEFANEAVEGNESNTQLTTPEEIEDPLAPKRKISLFKRRKDDEGEG
jgi:hypothetical protein